MHLVADSVAGDASVLGTITDSSNQANILLVDAGAGSTAAITGAVDLGDGANELIVRGADATSNVHFTDDGTNTGTVQTILGGSGDDSVMVMDATMFGNIDLATTAGGSDEVELDTAALTGDITMGSAAGNQVDIAGGSTLTGSLTFDTGSAGNNMRIEDAGNTISSNLVVNENLSIMADNDPGTHELTVSGEIRIAAGKTLTLNSGEVLAGGTITDADGGAGSIEGTLELLGGSYTVGDALSTQSDIIVKLSTGAQIGGFTSPVTISALTSTNPGDGTVDFNGQDITLSGANGSSNFDGSFLGNGDLAITGGTHTLGGGWTFGENGNDPESLTINNAGNTITLPGSNTIQGDVIVTAGTLVLSGDNTLGENGTDAHGLQVASGATATLTGSNTITGTIDLAGTLNAVTAGLGGATIVLDDGATIAADAGGALNATVDTSGLLDGESFTLDTTNNDVTISGATIPDLAGAGNVTMEVTGGNTATIAGLRSTSDAHAETWTVNDDVTVTGLNLAAEDSLINAANTLTLDGTAGAGTGTVDVSGTLTADTTSVGSHTMALNSGSTLQASSDEALAANVDLSGVADTGTFILDPTNNNVSITVTSGFGNIGTGATIDITDGASNTATIVDLSSDATSAETFSLGTNGDAVTIESPALHSGDTLEVQNGVAATFTGGDWSSGTLTGVAGSTLTINSGIAGGTVNVNGSGTLAGDISGGTINVDDTADITGDVTGGAITSQAGATVNFTGTSSAGAATLTANTGKVLATTAALGNAQIVVMDLGVFGAANGSGLTVTSGTEVDLSDINANGETFGMDVTQGDVTLNDYAAPNLGFGAGQINVSVNGPNTATINGLTTDGTTAGEVINIGGRLTLSGMIAIDAADFVQTTGGPVFLTGTLASGTVAAKGGGTVNFTGTGTGGTVQADGGTVYTTTSAMSGGTTLEIHDGGTVGAQSSTALTLDATAELDMSNLADTHGFTVDAQNADVTITGWAMPDGTVTVNGANTGTNRAVLDALVADNDGTDEILTIGSGKVFLTGTLTLNDSTDVISAAGGATVVMDGAIAGAGAVQAGAGTLLYGSNATLPATLADGDGVDVTAGDATFSTDVDLSGAHSFDGANTATFSGDVDFASNAITLTVATGTEVVLGGTVSDTGATGSLTQDGPGTLTLQTAVPTDVTASDGTLVLGTGGSVTGNLDASGAADVTLAPGTTVGGNLSVGTGTLTLSDDGIAGDVALTGSTVNAQTDFTLDGRFVLDTSVTIAGGNTLTITDQYSLTSPVTITVEDGTKLDLNTTAVAGGYKITKSGAGTLALNSNALNDVEVTAGTLMGTGLINGELTVGSAGTHAPGNSIGEQTVEGAYNLNGTLQVEIAKGATPENDKVIVAGGTATLGVDSVIQVTAASGSLQTGDEFTVIDSDTGLTDNGVEVQTLVGWDFTGSVDGVNYDYILTASSRPFMDLATNGNERSIGAALDAMGSNTLVTELRNLPDAQYSEGIRQVDPAPHTAPGLATLPGINQAMGNVAGRLSALRQGSAELAQSPAGPMGMAIASAADDPGRMAALMDAMEDAQGGRGGQADASKKGSFLTWRPFAKVYGTFVDQDTTAEQTGFSSSGVGMVTGVDTDVNEWLTAGMMFGYSHDDIDYDRNRGEADVHSLRVGPYASASFGDLFVDTSLTFGYHWNEVDRKVVVGAFNRKADSKYDAWDLTLYGGVGYDFDLAGWVLTPSASLQWTHYNQESFRESGAGVANLDVDSWESDTIRQVLAIQLRKMFHLDGVRIVPEAYLGWAHEYVDEDNVSARFVGQNTPFSFSPNTGDSDSLIFGAGTSVLLNETTSVYFRWDGQCGDETTAHNVAVGMSFSF